VPCGDGTCNTSNICKGIKAKKKEDKYKGIDRYISKSNVRYEEDRDLNPFRSGKAQARPVRRCFFIKSVA